MLGVGWLSLAGTDVLVAHLDPRSCVMPIPPNDSERIRAHVRKRLLELQDHIRRGSSSGNSESSLKRAPLESKASKPDRSR
jgi:hypothetical protein